ncbi:MAG: hypothetical protein EB120_05795, partial [Proteobacteria bacterium]|nr:hypothetical protein [Pseudomonadota bacterium]
RTLEESGFFSYWVFCEESEGSLSKPLLQEPPITQARFLHQKRVFHNEMEPPTSPQVPVSRL